VVDIGKQIAYWRAGADEDWSVGRDLVSRGRIRHGLFFAHLALEKTLKAHVCRATGQMAPLVHNLVRLAAIAGLTLTDDQKDLLAEANEFSIEGRYPHALLPPPSAEEAQEYLVRMGDLRQCLNSLF
jgi:HEPN domain-containing protein